MFLSEKVKYLYNGYVLTILTLGYLSSELGHFLIGVTSKATAKDVHYGDIKCQLLNKTDEHFNMTLHIQCDLAANEEQCNQLVLDSGEQYCEWTYNGLGLDYQILAGPSFIAVYTVVGVVFGFAADRHNRARLVSLSFLISSLSIALTGAAQHYWQLLLLRTVLAVGEAGCNPLSTGILSDLFPEDKRGLVMSIFNWGIYAGIGLAFPIGRYITKSNLFGIGWRSAYYFSGAFGLIVSLLCALTVPEPSRKTIGEEKDETNEKVENVCNGNQLKMEEAKKEDLWKTLLQPRIVMLCIAASIRHTGGICFAYNADLFYNDIFPNYDLGWTLFFVTFVVGSTGVIAGGIVSDKVAEKMGIRSRVAVLAISQLIATPFAFGSIYLEPVGAMITLAISYVFAEMWFGILFALLVEIVPLSVRSTTVGVFLFVMNNIGGNLPILVDPLRKATSFRHSLAIFYAGCYLVSSVLFAVTTLMMGKSKPSEKKSQISNNGSSNNNRQVSGIENGAFTIGNDFATGVYESRHI